MNPTLYPTIGALLCCAISLQAQTFFFDFDSNAQSGVFQDSAGSTAILDWNDSTSNPLEGAASGSLYFDLEPHSSLTRLDMAANSGSSLDWNAPGLGVDSSGFNAASEAISFVFDQNVKVVGFEFDSFTPAGSDSVSLKIGTDGPINYTPDGSVNDHKWATNLMVNAGETMLLSRQGGTFYLEGLSVMSVVPETGTTIGLALCLGTLLIARLRKRTAQS